MLFSIAAALFSIPTNVSISHHKGFSFSTSLPTFVVFYFFFFFNSLFYIELQPINNVVVVSGGQQRDSGKQAHVSLLCFLIEVVNVKCGIVVNSQFEQLVN